MISTLFLSKNQKLVKKWKDEHLKMLELSQMVLGEYAKGNHEQAKKYLKLFNKMSIGHIASEDIEFFKIIRGSGTVSHRTEEMIEEFTSSFGETKESLMQFLGKYTPSDVALDKTFFETFSTLAKTLKERIRFEEANLYLHLTLS